MPSEELWSLAFSAEKTVWADATTTTKGQRLILLTEIEMTFDNMRSDHLYMVESLDEGLFHSLDMISKFTAVVKTARGCSMERKYSHPISDKSRMGECSDVRWHL